MTDGTDATGAGQWLRRRVPLPVMWCSVMLFAGAVACAPAAPGGLRVAAGPSSEMTVPHKPLTTAEVDAFMRWLEALEIPSTRGRRYVRVQDEDEHERQRGFLLEEGPKHFTILVGVATIRYPVWTVTTDEAPPPSWHGLGAKALDKQLRDSPDNQSPYDGFEAISLARAAHERGRETDARRWLQHAAQRFMPATMGVQEVEVEPARPEGTAALRRAVAAHLWSAAVQRYSEGTMDRKALHDRARWLLERIRDKAAQAVLRNHIEALARMIAEDHAARPAQGPPATLAAALDGLVFALRDDRCDDSFSSFGRDAHRDDIRGRLRSLGYNALPALIAMRDDPRVTRCRHHDHSFWEGTPVMSFEDTPATVMPRLMRYGDVARSMLAKLMAPNRSAAELRAWSERLRSEGALEHRGRGEGGYLLNRAWSRTREDRAAGLQYAVALAKQSQGLMHLGLIRLIARRSHGEQLDFLAEIAHHSPMLEARLVAARGLHRQRRSDWVTPLLSELRRRGKPMRSGAGSVAGDMPFGLALDLRMSIDADPDRALPLLAAMYSEMPREDRIAILEAVAKVEDGTPHHARATAILVNALNDGSANAKPDTDGCAAEPRDHAAMFLAGRSSGNYDCTASTAERARAIEALKKRFGSGATQP